MELTEFLAARIAEDEAVARDAEGLWADQYGPHPLPSEHWADRLVATDVYSEVDACVAASPARVLAECEAKRRIVEMRTGAYDVWTSAEVHAIDQHLAIVLRALALPYRDHPDFDPAWAD